MDRYTNVPSGLISTSASLIGDIRTWVISRLNGVVAAPEKASGNLKERKQILYSGSQEHFQHISWNLIVKSTKLNNWSLWRVLSNWQIPTNKPRLTLLVFKYFAMLSLRNVQNHIHETSSLDVTDYQSMLSLYTDISFKKHSLVRRCEGHDGRRTRFWSSVNFAPGKSVRLNLMKLECLPRKHYGHQL